MLGDSMKKLFLISLLFSTLAFAQVPWTGLLTTARATDWRNAGVPGGVPNVTALCATQPSASIASINAAINADKGGASPCVINIPAVSGATGSIVVSYAGVANIVLRGTGANSSVITYSSGPGLSNCNGLNQTYVCVWNGDSSSPGNWVSTNNANWTGGLSQGSTVLTFSNTTNLKVGYQVVLYQTNPVSDTGNIWPCQTSGFDGACSWQGTGSTPTSTTSQSQMITVAACNGVSTYGSSCGAGTSVTSSTPIYLPNWNAGQSPKAAWGNTMPISGVGLEDFKVNDQTGTNGIFVELHQTVNSWVKGLATIANPAAASDTNHILVWASSHNTVEDSYMYGSYPASSGYGLDFAASSCDNLSQNDITQHMDTGFMSETGCANVYGYNYSIDNYFGGAWQQDDEYNHSAGDYYNLREGIEGIGYNSDNIHGTHWFNTVFRSRFSGFDPTTYTGGKSQSQVAISEAALARYDNVVGSVLGTSGKVSTYQLVPSSTTTCSPGPNTAAIYELGYSDSGSAYSPACLGTPNIVYNDVGTSAAPVTSTMRWDNYDTVHGAVQQNSGETASTASTYPGLVSPTTTLPASLYLPSGTPSWWTFPGGTTSPFPAVGPDVTGGNIANVGGYAWHNPAWNCYNVVNSGVTDGSPTPISFNRANCYGAAMPACADPVQLTPNTSGTYTVPPTVLPLLIGFSESTPGCQMYMTLDGSAPNCSSTAYASQSISSTTTMRTIACRVGYTTSNITGGLWQIVTGPPGAPSSVTVIVSPGP